MLWLAVSLLLARPVPMEMPQAESYLVKESGRYRLEDRYAAQDLWASRTVLAYGHDEQGRVFSISRLETELPSEDGRAVTRGAYARSVSPIARRDVQTRREAMAALSPVPLAESGERPRQCPRGYEDVVYWQGTNVTQVLCEFRPERSDRWYFASWTLLEDDDPSERIRIFEDDFLGREFRELTDFPSWREFKEFSEAEALRADAHDSVTNCPGWHWTDSDGYVVLDDLASSRQLVNAITNELPKLHAQFVRALPTTLESTNVLSVIRVFGNRDDFVAAADDSAKWSAAYWCTRRREIVACMPESGMEEFVRVFRHESLHQYLFYALAAIPSSPWFNEGYAEYFEDPESVRWELPISPEAAMPLLPSLFASDYEQFYSGSDGQRRINYALARSVVVFIEKGMREVRNDPFCDFKPNYMSALIATQDMRKATEAAFVNADLRDRFVYEWMKFWKNTLAD